ncbi:MAG TPA: helix-turn-helix domain-containing protein [Nitrososphaeraceae archaeon]|jgi:transposase|nr:helix-turn-helix domain-containing protein [Nitrososphaeraceae archaeon]
MIKRNTEESICHKTKDEEGVPYRTIAKNLGVNYRNVYEWIKKYRESGLDGIRNKRERMEVENQ